MAWLSKTDRIDDGQKYLAVFKIVCGLIFTERALIKSLGKLSFEDESGAINGPALGYLYGLVDAALQTANLEIHTHQSRVLLVGLFDLQAKYKGELYLEFLMHNIQHDDVHAAVCCGGQAYIDWAKSNGTIQPWGWGQYFGMRKDSAEQVGS
jgi:hypothetical protein